MIPRPGANCLFRPRCLRRRHVVVRVGVIGRGRSHRAPAPASAAALDRALQLVLDASLELREHDEQPRGLRRREELSQLGDAPLLRIPERLLVADRFIDERVERARILDRVRRLEPALDIGALLEQAIELVVVLRKDREQRARRRLVELQLLGQRVRAQRADLLLDLLALVRRRGAEPRLREHRRDRADCDEKREDPDHDFFLSSQRSRLSSALSSSCSTVSSPSSAIASGASTSSSNSASGSTLLTSTSWPSSHSSVACAAGTGTAASITTGALTATGGGGATGASSWRTVSSSSAAPTTTASPPTGTNQRRHHGRGASSIAK